MIGWGSGMRRTTARRAVLALAAVLVALCAALVADHTDKVEATESVACVVDARKPLTTGGGARPDRKAQQCAALCPSFPLAHPGDGRQASAAWPLPERALPAPVGSSCVVLRC
ncbi:hypothetical protein ABZ922_40010 [Streptomyces shenzhenensis]|uniref:hypothetical protein n=1 Tax=Streptomyces shenzhenensis TaxID=943815 RepID=UPI0033F3A77A